MYKKLIEKKEGQIENIVIKNIKINTGGIKSQKGITLVALVVTIVIIIILSSVSINVLLGEGGLIQQAKLAKELASNSTIAEEESMNTLMQEYANIMASEPEIPEPTDPTEGWDLSKVTAVESGDDEPVIVPVPIGYTASKATGEDKVQDGFVIYEGTDEVNDENVAGAKTSRNQFIWVPVDDISKMANQISGTDGNGRQNYQGKLYDFSTSGATWNQSYVPGSTDYREPDIVTQYDGSDATNDASYFKTAISTTMTGSEFKTQLEEEYNEMVESVQTYGGFYIGRYETGNLAANTTTEPVVVKGNNSISEVNWYYMYQNSKKIAANNNVTSTMIWGSMFERTLIWLTETGEKSYSELKDSRTWGNYSDSTGEAVTNSGSKQTTGKNDAWKANNIYDLAGNVYDWTIEAYGTNSRVLRGGNYSFSGSGHPASDRLYSLPSSSYSYYGSRSALYVTLNAE